VFDSRNLSEYGITDTIEVVYNPSYNILFAEETKPGSGRFEKGIITRCGAISVDTGTHSEYLIKDRYVVLDDKTRDTVWWKSILARVSENKPVLVEVWNHLKNISGKQLSGKRLFVVDCYCGARENSRIRVRFIMEIAWQAHFIKNIFIRPEPEELEDFKPDFVVLNPSTAVNHEWQKQGLNSENFIVFNFTENMALIGGTLYGGEMKKCLFSVMNYYLSSKGVAAMQCAANAGNDGGVAVFFGLSGTGKTTLSTDPDRMLLGDDAHGWDDEGIFSFEAGCYAKCTRLSREGEPDIFDAIKRDALLENLVVLSDGRIDFSNESKAENTRVSYPIYHIKHIVQPASMAGHVKKIILLSTDCFGVLPPVSKLTEEQAGYYFLSGYSSKITRTEKGLTETIPSFSPCFCSAFLMTDPVGNLKELDRKIKDHGSEVWLINTGWIGGPYGTGNRIDLQTTRRIISAVLNDSFKDQEFDRLPVFNLNIPRMVEGVDDHIIDPGRAWDSRIKWHIAATDLAFKFITNFSKFTSNPETAGLAEHGPRIS